MAKKIDSKREIALQEIHALLDGTHWSPGTLDDIAEVMRASGFAIRDPLQLGVTRRKKKKQKHDKEQTR